MQCLPVSNTIFLNFTTYPEMFTSFLDPSLKFLPEGIVYFFFVSFYYVLLKTKD